MSGIVISLANRSEVANRIARDSTTDGNGQTADTIVEETIGSTRAQLRLPLIDIGQVERDLTIIRDACDRGLAMVRSAKRTSRGARDLPLATIRALFGGVNRMLNVKHQGR